MVIGWRTKVGDRSKSDPVRTCSAVRCANFMLWRTTPLDVLISPGIKGLHGDISWRVGITRGTRILRPPLDGTLYMEGRILMRSFLDCVGRRVVHRGRWLLPQDRINNIANYIFGDLSERWASQNNNPQVSGSWYEGSPFP